jgi:uncharacterized protein YbjQ (UPF0145 family)
LAEKRGEEAKMVATTLEQWPGRKIEIGMLIVTTVVRAANVIKDIRENIRNLTGGRMTHYERLIQEAADEAVAESVQKAKDAGYDGIVGVKFAHPTVADGAVEMIVYASAFRFLD